MFVKLQSCAVLKTVLSKVQSAYKIYSLIKKKRRKMTGKNLDTAMYIIKIPERILIVGNVVSHWVYCAETGEKIVPWDLN